MNKYIQGLLREDGEPALVGMQQGLLIRAGIYTPTGQLFDEVIQPAHSYVNHWAILLNYKFSDAGQNASAWVDTAGNSKTPTANNTRFLRTDAAINIDTHGIVVGTGSTAVAMTDTKLVTQIAQGSGSGQLTHGIMQAFTVDAVGASTPRYVNLARGFQNNSGAAITVSEAGLYGQHQCSDGTRNFCVCRDLITFTIPIGYLAVVQYQMVFNLA